MVPHSGFAGMLLCGLSVIRTTKASVFDMRTQNLDGAAGKGRIKDSGSSCSEDSILMF